LYFDTSPVCPQCYGVVNRQRQLHNTPTHHANIIQSKLTTAFGKLCLITSRASVAPARAESLVNSTYQKVGIGNCTSGHSYVGLFDVLLKNCVSTLLEATSRYFNRDPQVGYGQWVNGNNHKHTTESFGILPFDMTTTPRNAFRCSPTVASLPRSRRFNTVLHNTLKSHSRVSVGLYERVDSL
jgi:hypothetical protein